MLVLCFFSNVLGTAASTVYLPTILDSYLRGTKTKVLVHFPSLCCVCVCEGDRHEERAEQEAGQEAQNEHGEEESGPFLAFGERSPVGVRRCNPFARR